MKALIVVDMQNDFIDGSLGTPEANAIVENVRELVDSGIYDRIIYTRDTHGTNYLETFEGRHLPVEHCIKDTHGWKISNKLNLSSAEIIDKPTFGYTKWKDKLQDCESIDIVGLCTDICVISNALILRAIYPDVEISIIKNATAGTTPSKKQSALDVALSCQINVI